MECGFRVLLVPRVLRVPKVIKVSLVRKAKPVQKVQKAMATTGMATRPSFRVADRVAAACDVGERPGGSMWARPSWRER